MSELENLPRRRFLMRVALSAGALVMSGCQKLSESEWFPKVLALGERASAAVMVAEIIFRNRVPMPGWKRSGSALPIARHQVLRKFAKILANAVQASIFAILQDDVQVVRGFHKSLVFDNIGVIQVLQEVDFLHDHV